MMGEDEGRTLTLLESQRNRRSLIGEHRGQVLKFIGDAVLSTYESASDAVHCAVAIQRALAARNAREPEERRILIRIGIHVGDIVLKDNDVFGDGVNIAARVEPLAPHGGICITQSVYEMVRANQDIATVSLGAKELKNIKDPVNIYRVVVDAASERNQGANRAPRRASLWLA